MAKRQFEIQGSKFRIGNVDLEVGATGVVVPGLTQATNYRVEEVEETDNIFIGTFNSVPVVIDGVTYNDYDTSGTSSNRATYTAELAGLTIKEIDVNTDGVYTVTEANTNGSNNMYAYTGSSLTPLSPFVSSDWTSIPFRPKMRAKDISYVGGGGGDTGDITFDGVKIKGAGTASGDGLGYATMELVPDDSLYSNGQYLIIDPTGPNHIHIRAGGPIDQSQSELILGGEKLRVRVYEDDGNAGVFNTQEVNLRYNSYNAGTADFGTATYTDNGTFKTITLTTVSQAVLEDIWASNNISFLYAYTGAVSYTFKFQGGSNTPGAGQNANFTVLPNNPADPMPADGTTFTQVSFDLEILRTTKLEVDGNDVRIEAADDVRIYSRDTFLLANYGINDSIRISTQYDTANEKDWYFNSDGDLQLPVGGDIIDSNGNSVLGGATNPFDQNLNTTDFPTFPGVVGSGYNFSISPGPQFVADDQRFRFRGGDVASHLHFDTTNSMLYDLYVGDDSQYVKISKDGTIDIGTQTVTATNNTWQFDRVGDFLVPGKVKARYTDQIGQTFTNIPTWDSDGSGIYTWFNVTINDRPDVYAVGQVIAVGWLVQVNGGNDAIITSINPAGFFSFTTNVPLTGTGTLNFSSPNYQPSQPTDLVLEAGIGQVRLTSAGHIDHAGMVRTFKPVSASVGAGVSGTIWDTNLDVQAVKFLVHGVEATTNKSQSCEVLLTKDAADALAVTVYALVHTSANPLFTLDAAYNNVTGATRLDASIPGANNVGFTVHVTAIYYD